MDADDGDPTVARAGDLAVEIGERIGHLRVGGIGNALAVVFDGAHALVAGRHEGVPPLGELGDVGHWLRARIGEPAPVIDEACAEVEDDPDLDAVHVPTGLALHLRTFVAREVGIFQPIDLARIGGDVPAGG